MVDQKYYTIDFHCHVFPDKIAERAVAGTDVFYGTTSAGRGTVADLLARGTAAGIDRFVIHSVATTPKQAISINKFISETVASDPVHFFGYGAIHPDGEEPAAEIENIRAMGLHGIKIHPDIQGVAVDDPRYMRYYAECEKAGIPVLMHTGDYRYDFSNPERLLHVLRAFPKMTVVGAHFGGWSVYEEACEKLAGIDNLYVDCSSSFPYLTDGQATAIIRRYGADRVLFGADYPMWEPADVIKRLMGLPLTDEERRLILGENAQRVFGV